MSFANTSVEPGIADRSEIVLRAPALRLTDLRDNFRNLLRYRDLIYTLSVHRVKVRYKQTVLGVSWAILQPLAIMLVFTLLFSIIVKVPSNGAPYSVFAYAAVLPWTFFSTAVASGVNGLVSHSQLITKIYFPREILPLTYVIAAAFDFFIASTVLAGLMIYYRIPLTAYALYAVPIMAVLLVFAVGVTLLLSSIQVRFRDVGVALPFLLQFWMYATPVIYPLRAVPQRLLPIYCLNPMVGIIEGFRQALLFGSPPDPNSFTISAFASVVLFAGSYLFFKRTEATMADVI